MCRKWKMLLAVLIVCTSCLIAGCGGGGADKTASSGTGDKPTASSSSAEKNDQHPSQEEQHKKSETAENDISSGKPVTQEMIQSFRDSVTEEEMSLFIHNIAKRMRYTEAQVRDIAARMKMVGIDFSMIAQGEVAGDILSDGLSFKITPMSNEEKFSFASGTYVFVQLQKDDKSKVVAIDLSVKENSYWQPLYTLYKNDKIIGDFSDVIITLEMKEKIVGKVHEYVSNIGGNIPPKDPNGVSNLRIGVKSLTITKDALSDESKWKGNEDKPFPFPIISVWVRYNAPSEVYGVKEQEKRERFLFNRNGELLIVVPEAIHQEKEKSHYNKLLTEALKNIKL